MPPSPACSLADQIARRRIVYASPVPTLPDVLVIDVALANRGEGLALGRYYPIILETQAEREEIERFLVTPRTRALLLDILDNRPSTLRSQTILVMRYEPPEAGWPWLSLTRWTDMFRRAAHDQGLAMARGCYTMELFETIDGLETHQQALLRQLSDRHGVEIGLLAGDSLPPAGTA